MTRGLNTPVSSFVVAVVIATVAMTGPEWTQEGRQFPWHVFVAALWIPLWIAISLQGGLHGFGGPGTDALIFVLVVVFWFLLSEGGRRWWKRQRRERSPTGNANGCRERLNGEL
jgi:hypothetical protein